MIMPTTSPHEAAERILAEAPSEDWVRALTDYLDRHIRSAPLERIQTVWGVSATEVGRMMGVSRQAVSKWKDAGVPPDRQVVLADLDAATDILHRRLKRERIPAVVRRPIPALGGKSLLELAQSRRSDEVLAEVRRTFDLRRLQP